MSVLRVLCALLALVLAGPVSAQETSGELAKIKEQELEEVRERISALKKSMDSAAEDRDRLTGELQEIEIRVAEQRSRIRDLPSSARASATLSATSRKPGRAKTNSTQSWPIGRHTSMPNRRRSRPRSVRPTCPATRKKSACC
jgi:septal ring factor EnvC (AmiA/AmiB activator)